MGNTLGLHALAIAPAWDLARIEPQMDRLKEFGIGLLEVPLAGPERIDGKRARSFATHYRVDLSASLDMPRGLDIIEQSDEALDFVEQALATCGDIGSELLGGMVYGAVRSGRATTVKEIDGLSRFMERAAKLARGRGLKLGIVPCNRYKTHFVNRAAEATRLIERIGADNLFIQLDSFHMHMEEESFAAAFEAAAPFLGYVQVSEANRGVPGRGMLDWAACMKAISDIGYGGPITLKGAPQTYPGAAADKSLWRAGKEDPRDFIEVGIPFVRDEARKAGLTLG